MIESEDKIAIIEIFIVVLLVALILLLHVNKVVSILRLVFSVYRVVGVSCQARVFLFIISLALLFNPTIFARSAWL